MEEGELDASPIFTDLRAFDGIPWRGIVDCITAGFPCQPHSVAGRRAGQDDERDLWPEVRRVVEEVRPSILLFENVPGILTVANGSFFAGVLADLERLDYSVAFDLFTAAEVGASHKRERVFIVGVANGERAEPGSGERGRQATGKRRRRPANGGKKLEHGERGGNMANSDEQHSDLYGRECAGLRVPAGTGGPLVHAGGDGRRLDEQGARPDRRAATGETGSASDGLGERMADSSEPRRSDTEQQTIQGERGWA
jgi:DNA (cytosine-5)-methyltransferase 1